MIEGIKPKDIRKYKTKFVGMFTLQQAILFIVGLVLCYGAFIFQKEILMIKPNGYICMGVAAIPISFGYITIEGMSLFKYLKIIIADMKEPEVYVYKVDNDYKREIRQMEKEASEKLTSADRRKIKRERKTSDKNIKMYK